MARALDQRLRQRRRGGLSPIGAPGVGHNAPMSSLIRYLPGSAPLVLDSPHSGVDYPADFRPACDLATLRRAEDTHVEKLYDFAPDLGIAWIEALFPRSYLDANRNLTELDVALLADAWPDALETDPQALSKVRLGKGLVWRCTDDGLDIYDRKLTAAEVRGRIERCWRPYHAAVADAIDRAHARHGYSIHLNCHSMPAIAVSVARRELFAMCASAKALSLPIIFGSREPPPRPG